ncbi:hypothetical protein, partial [Shigella flexneri]|uniref:hypothetical protein n=1 Tax=Shigella flexneri TaxID=623 RepID=UPI000B9F5295
RPVTDESPQHVAGFLHSITGKNAHGATLIRKCALRPVTDESPQHVAGFLHSITGKNAHGATLIRKCA